MREFGFVGGAMGTNATVLGGKLAKSTKPQSGSLAEGEV